ncbi:YSIRK-type signal peptide-containing protein [Streptococcus ruminantium]|nr:YSIRK-type signal peptide-containing protein [Streptococcus ruminantium]MDQ8815933.1 YSIRK-type signal peptide-containing protein [Streptococcus ruminantium]MDQ8817823.1 YSIRK-type signal peptide-containing protein [Streptococcus ruminantium]
MTPQKKRHYSIRKLQAGAGSILIGTTLLFGLSTQVVQANTATAESSTTASTGKATVTSEEPTAATTTGETTSTEPTSKEETQEKDHKYWLYYRKGLSERGELNGQARPLGETEKEGYDDLKEKENRIEKAKERYAQQGYPHSDRFDHRDNTLLVFHRYKTFIVLKTVGDSATEQTSVFYGDKREQDVKRKVEEWTNLFKETYDVKRSEEKKEHEKTITLTLTPKSDKAPEATPEQKAPKKDKETPAPSQPKQDDSMKKDYKLFYQTKDKTEEVNFKGTPEELKATLDKAIEKYKQNGYPYVDRFERENRILLVFNQHKSIIVLETNGDGGSRQSRPFYGTPQELEAEIKKLTESLSDTYKIEKKEGYDKLEPTVKTITLVLTKLSDTPKETPAPKKEDKPTPPKDEKQTQPEDKKPEQPKKDEKQTQPEGKKAEKPKDEKQTQPEGKKAEKPKDEKQTQPEGKKPEQPKDKKPVPAPKKAEKAMPSKARTPKKVLPNTGEVPSILAVLGSGLLGFLGIAHTKKRKK